MSSNITKHDVAVIVVDLGEAEENHPSQQKRGLTEILPGDEALPVVGGHQTSWQQTGALQVRHSSTRLIFGQQKRPLAISLFHPF